MWHLVKTPPPAQNVTQYLNGIQGKARGGLCHPLAGQNSMFFNIFKVNSIFLMFFLRQIVCFCPPPPDKSLRTLMTWLDWFLWLVPSCPRRRWTCWWRSSAWTWRCTPRTSPEPDEESPTGLSRSEICVLKNLVALKKTYLAARTCWRVRDPAETPGRGSVLG